MFAVISKKILSILYLSDLLEVVKSKFCDIYKNELAVHSPHNHSHITLCRLSNSSSPQVLTHTSARPSFAPFHEDFDRIHRALISRDIREPTGGTKMGEKGEKCGSGR